jgi:hypothetical protein
MKSLRFIAFPGPEDETLTLEQDFLRHNKYDRSASEFKSGRRQLEHTTSALPQEADCHSALGAHLLLPITPAASFSDRRHNALFAVTSHPHGSCPHSGELWPLDPHNTISRVKLTVDD